MGAGSSAFLPGSSSTPTSDLKVTPEDSFKVTFGGATLSGRFELPSLFP